MTNRLDIISMDEGVQVQLPNGFTVNPRLTNDLNYVIAEIKVAISIAFGDHGLGEKEFTEDNPFFVMVMDSKENPLPVHDFPARVEAMVKKEYPKYVDKIEVQTVNVA